MLDGDVNANQRFRLEWAHRDVKVAQSPIVLDKKTMKKYVGTYGPRKILLDLDTLYYQRDFRPRIELIPLSDNWFKLQDINYFRIKFLTGKTGTITTLVGVYDDGSENPNERND
jgi:hypothetical protein